MGAYGDDDAVWYDAEVVKVMKRLVEVFYPADDATRRHNLLVSGITDKSPEPFENYMSCLTNRRILFAVLGRGETTCSDGNQN